MATVTGNPITVEERVLELRAHICRVIRAPQVLRWMCGFISQADVTEINSVDSRAPEKASFLLIDKIIRCNKPGKWKAFTEALDHADYSYQASLIKSPGKDHEQFHHQKRILQIFAPYLELQLEPYEIISQMGDSGLVNAEDIDEIMTCQRNQGSVGATMLLLDRMQRRQAPSKWYMDFLKILYQKGYTDIVKEMEPDFTLDCEVLKVPNIHVTDNSTSNFTFDEQDSVMENRIQSKVMCLKSEITVIVNVKKMAATLCQLIGIEKVCHLMRISSRSPKESIVNMLDEISLLSSKTKWRQFIHCLKESDYTHLAEILSRPGTGIMQSKERELIKLFVPTLGQQLDPAELVPYLEQVNVINQQDKEEIICTLRQCGSVAASVVLLDCMQCRVAPHVWFRAFITALVNCGREDLAQTIDPDFHKVDSVPSDGTDAENNTYGIGYLLTKVDEAHNNIYNLEKAAMDELLIMQEHFEVMKSNLKEQIENNTSMLVKSLQNAEEGLRVIQCNDAFFGRNEDNDRLIIEENLQDVLSTNYILRPMETFTALKELGVLQRPRHSLHRQNSIDKPDIASSRHNSMKHKVFALRKKEKSTGSSSSSQSSGYLIVEKSTSLSSNGSTSDSFASTDKQNSKFAETERSRSINVNHFRRLKQSVFHAVPEHEELKPLIGADENGPGSCKVWSPVSVISVSDLPESSSKIGCTNERFSESKESLRMENGKHLNGSRQKVPEYTNTSKRRNISEPIAIFSSLPDVRFSSNTTSKSKTLFESKERSKSIYGQLFPHLSLKETQIHTASISYIGNNSASGSLTNVSDLLPHAYSADTTTVETLERDSLDEEDTSSINTTNEDTKLQSDSCVSIVLSVSSETFTDSTDSSSKDKIERVTNNLECSSMTNIQIAEEKRNVLDRLLCHMCIKGKKK